MTMCLGPIFLVCTLIAISASFLRAEIRAHRRQVKEDLDLIRMADRCLKGESWQWPPDETRKRPWSP